VTAALSAEGNGSDSDVDMGHELDHIMQIATEAMKSLGMDCNESGIDVDNAGRAILEVGARSRAVAELLIAYEQRKASPSHNNLCASGPRNDRDATVASGHNLLGESATDDIQVGIAAALFMELLRTYLGLAGNAGCDTESRGAVGVVLSSEATSSSASIQALSGLALATLQGLVPLATLLGGGMHITIDFFFRIKKLRFLITCTSS
jgi:hypothetical protein